MIVNVGLDHERHVNQLAKFAIVRDRSDLLVKQIVAA
jgi:hypothetical protein